MDFSELLNQRYQAADAALRASEKALGRYVCPLYDVGERGEPCICGSGVLLSIGTRHFLITAEHALSEAKSRDTTIYYVGAQKVLHVLEAPAAKNVAYDFAIIGLPLESSQQLESEYSFLGLADVDANDVAQSGALYAFIGYPETKTTAKHALSTVKSELYSILCVASNAQTYESLQRNDIYHLVMNFLRDRVVSDGGQLQTAPLPYGMSGGGVWRMFAPTDSSPSSAPAKLVGITIEWDKKRRAVTATRISLVLEAIRNYYPDLKDLIPAATRFVPHFQADQ